MRKFNYSNCSNGFDSEMWSIAIRKCFENGFPLPKRLNKKVVDVASDLIVKELKIKKFVGKL